MRAHLSCAVLSLTTLLTGCVQAYHSRPGALQPATAMVAPAERAAVWQHAVVALLEQGYLPQVLNESAGYISARRRDDIDDDVLTGSIATVVVSPDGTVRAEVSGAGLFSSEQGFFNAVGTRQHQIMQAIMGGRAPVK